MEKKFKMAKSTVSFLTIASLVLAYFPFAAQAALTPGGAVGPVNPTTGLPNWYMDQNGLALELIEAADGFGASAPVDPTNPYSVATGLGDESFYWTGEADVIANGIDALVVLAMEANSTQIADASAFARARFKIEVPVAGTYTVRHPFGTETFVVETDLAPGSPEIRNAGMGGGEPDIGCFAVPGVSSCNPNDPLGSPTNNFGTALQGGVGPFLTWDTFNLDPALSDPALINPAFPGKRYVGNAAVPHLIKGSPVGQNFFEITGPGGIVARTEEFFVSGRIAVVDTIPPVIGAVTPTEVIVDAVGNAPANTIVSANITDDLGVRAASINLTALGSNFNSTLNGAQEVPATASQATGSGTFTIDTTANTLSFNISFSGLQAGDNEVGAHIHGPAPIGVTSPNNVFALPLGSPKTGVWNYPENLEADILASQMYIQIHSLLFPSGVIRGQIVPVSNVQSMLLTAGTPLNGMWSIVIPQIPRMGTFNLPILTHDGSNIVNSSFSLSVVNPAPVATPDAATIGTNIGESANIAVLANDTDSNGNLPLSLVSVQNVSAGTGVVSGNNVVITSPTNVFAGTITAQYTVADSLGATSNGDITVTVVRDVTPPVVTLNGVNPMAVVAGTPYVEPGVASVVDDFDGVLPIASVQVVSTVPAGNLVVGTGPFTVTYSIADAVGNLATVVRTVNVETPVFNSVSVTPSPLTIVIGQTRQMSAVALDQAGNPLTVQPTFAWSSANTTVASITGGGLVAGGTVGTAVMTASATVGATTLSGTSNVTVSACETGADTDANGSIGNLEILNYVREWKAGNASNQLILRAIIFWKAGSGC